MPQGGVEKGEDLHVAALRELSEEIGTNKADMIRIHHTTIKYDFPDHLLDTLLGGQYCGQEQSWVAMRFTGNDDDIDLTADETPEFRAWKWVALDETLDLIVPFKKQVYEQVITAFNDLME